jgi:sugar phosphate isomerase/epimerase
MGAEERSIRKGVDRFEARQSALDPHRQEERAAAMAEVSARLRDRGVQLTGRESSEELVRLLDAVESFERAVEQRGGDLMVDEGPHGSTREPDDPHFVLPKRGDEERVEEYVLRIDEAAARLRGR